MQPGLHESLTHLGLIGGLDLDGLLVRCLDLLGLGGGFGFEGLLVCCFGGLGFGGFPAIAVKPESPMTALSAVISSVLVFTSPGF